MTSNSGPKMRLVVLAIAVLAIATSTRALAGDAALTLSPNSTAPRYFAAESPSNIGTKVEAPEGWRFTLGIPLWLPALDGDLTVKGLTYSGNQQTDDVVDLLDEHLNFAMALHAEAQKDRLGFFADFMYVSVAAERDTVFGTTIEADVDGFIGEAGVLYTVYTTTPSDRRNVPIRVDALAGVRVTALGLDVETENLGSADDSKAWFDPFIGLRGEVGLLKWLSVKARGDIGGFDLFDDASSQLTWHASAAASFHLGSSCNLDAGYRWLSYDYEEGSGFDRFALDAVLHGPYIELAFSF